MNMIMKEYRTPILWAMIQWFITTILQIDRLFFAYDNENKQLLIVKALYFSFLLVAWCLCYKVIKEIKAESPVYKRGLRIFITYLSILMMLLLFLWPGTWAWDDLGTITAISDYSGFNAWQHILSGIYQDVLLQVLPFPGGIIFLQNVIIAACVAFVIIKLELAFEIKKIKFPIMDLLLKIIPFLLPPVLMYQFSGYRMGVYVYFELTMLVILICAIKDKKEWTWKYIGFFCFMAIIVACWRTESFLYIPSICILLLFVKKNTIPSHKKIACILMLVVGFIGMTKWQSASLGNSNYKIISLLRPCAEVVRAADYTDDAYELEAINKVLDLEVIHNNPTCQGEWLYWNTSCVRQYSEEEYSGFLKAFVKLSIKYPKVVLTERWNVFAQGVGITGETIENVSGSALLFEMDNENGSAWKFLSGDWLFNKPAFKQVRKALIYALGMRTYNGEVIGAAKRLIWNASLPIMFLVYAWIKFLIQKKWYLWFVCSAIIVRIPIVFLTAPASWIMYFLSFYFLGNVFAVYKIWIHFSKEGLVNE